MGSKDRGAARPLATHPPVRAIIGNSERRSFNFILSTARDALHNVIISSRSAGPSDRAVLSRHWGNANWFHISGGIFKVPTCYIDCHFRERYENQRKMSNCADTTLYTACCLLWSLPPGTRYFLMPHCHWTIEEVCIMLLTGTLAFSTSLTGIWKTTAAKMLRASWLEWKPQKNITEILSQGFLTILSLIDVCIFPLVVMCSAIHKLHLIKVVRQQSTKHQNQNAHCFLLWSFLFDWLDIRTYYLIEHSGNGTIIWYCSRPPGGSHLFL